MHTGLDDARIATLIHDILLYANPDRAAEDLSPMTLGDFLEVAMDPCSDIMHLVTVYREMPGDEEFLRYILQDPEGDDTGMCRPTPPAPHRIDLGPSLWKG